MTERSAYIQLNMMEKVGPIAVRSLVECLGSVDAIMTASGDELQRARGVGPELARAIVRQREMLDAQAEEGRAEALGAQLVTPVDEAYPRLLKEIHDPPLALYVRGSLEAGDRRAIAVVGTRSPSRYGRDMAERLAGQLAQAGFAIVSGLAEGIDTVAHRAALAAKGRTIGVLGSALDCLYPASNRGLADAMCERGAVLSELPLGRKPDKTTFPMRNRIVSGLSMGVLVVEAGPTSGTLITARQASEQGRTLFAVPGRIDSSKALGCHRLIRDGACLVTGVEDILTEFEFLIPPRREPSVPSHGHLTDDERRLVAALTDGECPVDSLVRVSGLKPAEVSVLLLGLEMKRVVRMLPGRSVALRHEGV